MEGGRAAGVCRHPAGAAGEGCSVTQESHNEVWRCHIRLMEVVVSGRQVLGHDGTGIRADSAARGGISRRAHERVDRQQNGTKGGQTSLLHGDERLCGEGAMGRRTDQRSEGAAGTGQGSATQEVPCATACRTKLTNRGGPEREA